MRVFQKFGQAIMLIFGIVGLAGCAYWSSTGADKENSAECPQLAVREGEHLRQAFLSNRDKTDENLAYQVVISSLKRSCKFEQGGLRMKIEISGRIVTGPAWNPRSLTIPVYFSMFSADNSVVASGSWKKEESLLAGEFSKSWKIIDESIVVPNFLNASRILVRLSEDG